MMSSFLFVTELKLMGKLLDTLRQGAGADGYPYKRLSLFFVRLFQLLIDIPYLYTKGLTEFAHVF
jgi:hypothetical protein